MNLSSSVILFLSLCGSIIASDVLVFTDSNFATSVAEHETILVEFYAPWCGHCKKLAPEYEAAATALQNNDPPVPLAKVDCTVETSTCSKYGVSGYPTLKIFKNGEFSKDYDGGRDKTGIMKVMKSLAGPVSKPLLTVDDVNNFINKNSLGVVGFYDDESSERGKNFIKMAGQLTDLRFGHCTNMEVREAFKQTESVVLFRPKILQSKFEDNEVKTTDTSLSKMKEAVENAAMGLCSERTQGNAANYKYPLFVAYYTVDYVKNAKGTNYWRNRVMKVGKKIKDEGETLYLAISDVDELGNELDECGHVDRGGEKPVVCAFDAKKRKFKMTEEFSMESFEKFVRDVLADKVEPHLKSEDVPDNSNEDVKIVVAKNFDEIVNDEDRDVLIEFYAPWCGHCKSLAPKYEELAQKLKSEESVTIAKMDATANDVPGPYEVRGFPTIYYAPKGSKASPRKYEGGREVDDFIKFLAKESTDGLTGFGRDGKKKKKAKKEL